MCVREKETRSELGFDFKENQRERESTKQKKESFYLWLTESPRRFSAGLPSHSTRPPRRASPPLPLAFSVYVDYDNKRESR